MYTSLCVALFVVAILLQRVILQRGKPDSGAFAGGFQLLVAAVLLPIALLHDIDFSGYSAVWLPVSISVACFGMGSVVYAKALKQTEAGVFTVIFASQAVWVALFGVVVLGELMRVNHIAGSALVFASIALLVKRFDNIRASRGLVLSLLTGFIYGIAVTASSYVGRHVDVLTWTFVSFALSGLASFAVSPRGVQRLHTVFRPATLPLLLVTALLYGLGSFTMTLAYRDGPFSLVAPLRQTATIFTTLLAFAFLRDERHDATRKVAAALLCCLGAICLTR